MNKSIDLPSLTKDRKTIVGKTSVEKQKTWKVVLDKWDYTKAPSPTSTVNTNVSSVNSTSVEILISTNQKLVDIL